MYRRTFDRALRGVPARWVATIEWLLTIVAALVVVIVIKSVVINPYRIPSSSMEPTLHCARPADGCQARFSDRVLACRICYRVRAPRRGDIVVFRTPPLAAARCGMGGTYVKRLVGLPGEVWEERQGLVYIDGRRLSEPYVRANRRDGGTSQPARIAPGHYLMLGDNRIDSCDSRRWGTVPRANLIGEVVATYWPPPRMSVG